VRMGTEEYRHVSLLEIEARLRRLALTVADLPSRSRAKSPAVLGRQQLSRAEQMACFIAQHYTEPLTAETISQHVGVHPNYAMSVFQRTFGTTLLKYVTQHRLSHAQRLLVTTEDLILNIALKSGFGSLSRFNEAFRQAFGCTPREYRRNRGVGLQIADRPLNARQIVSQQGRVCVRRLRMAQRTVEDAALAVGSNPTERIVAVGPQARVLPLGQVEAQEHADALAGHRLAGGRFAEDVDLVADSKLLPVQEGGQRMVGLFRLDPPDAALMAHGLPAVHLGQLRPVDAARDGRRSVDADQPFARGHKTRPGSS
jgi:AraC-like DNA-binding protein